MSWKSNFFSDTMVWVSTLVAMTGLIVNINRMLSADPTFQGYWMFAGSIAGVVVIISKFAEHSPAKVLSIMSNQQPREPVESKSDESRAKMFFTTSEHIYGGIWGCIAVLYPIILVIGHYHYKIPLLFGVPCAAMSFLVCFSLVISQFLSVHQFPFGIVRPNSNVGHAEQVTEHVPTADVAQGTRTSVSIQSQEQTISLPGNSSNEGQPQESGLLNNSRANHVESLTASPTASPTASRTASPTVGSVQGETITVFVEVHKQPGSGPRPKYFGLRNNSRISRIEAIYAIVPETQTPVLIESQEQPSSIPTSSSNERQLKETHF